MTTLPFSASGVRSKSVSHSIPSPSFLDFNRNSKQFFIRTPCFNHSRRRNLSVKNVASDQKQQVMEPNTEEATIASSIKYHSEFTPSFSPEHFLLPKAFHATAESVRDMIIINWNATNTYYEKMNVKQAYYLSMEYLQGRALLNVIGNLELSGAYAEALTKLGHNLEDLARQEPDAALGNGGLGRLASCFLDSLATLNYPAWGYGLRYKYGLFKQLITKEGQEEVAESWLEMGSPWEIARNDVSYPVTFYGNVISGPDGSKRWVGGENIMAVAFDVPIPGYKTKTTINLRLWSTKVAPQEFDLHAFNAGDHAKAYAAIKNAEKICYILYPGDELLEGKTLRLKQQYTLCSASLQDIIARYERRSGEPLNWENFPEKVAVQMNDTHPTLCIPELMRILMDVKGLSWREAWNINQRTVAYTNHTVLPEALEKWSLELMEDLLPRHVEIIRMIDEELWPEKFQNKTNGVTPRRWIHFCNPDLSKIITKWTGTEDWIINTQKLETLQKFTDNEDLHSEWREAKRRNKIKVASFLKEKTGYVVSPDAMFDVQVKRIHEYKRQLLNIMGIVYRYKKMKEMSPEERKASFVPRVCIFGGKAFATYVQAKRIVKFITDVGATVNHDPHIGDLLKVVFVPDYNAAWQRCLFLVVSSPSI